MTPELTIGQLAEVAGVDIQAVRDYELLDLLTPAARKPSGYRLYGSAEIARLRFIKNARTLGFTLREIAELLSLQTSSMVRCRDVQQKVQAKLEQVEAKVQDLGALVRALRNVIRACRAGQSTDHGLMLHTFERRGFQRRERRRSDGKRNATSRGVHGRLSRV